MDCKECGDILDAYVAGELSDGQTGAVKSHLEICEGCSATAAGYRAAFDDLRSAAAVLPEADRAFYRGLRRRLDESDLRLGRRGMPALRWHFLGGVAAAAAAVLIVATSLIPHIGPSDAGPSPEGLPSVMKSQADLDALGEGFPVRPIAFYPPGDGISSYFMPVPFLAHDNVGLGSVSTADFVSKEEYRRLELLVGECQERIRELEAKLERALPGEAAGSAH